jgi:hypothetical protein
MDPLTHLIISKVLIGNDRSVLIAGLAPDAPFYATYPFWIIVSRQLLRSVQQNSWPEPPAWMYVPHHIAHSLPMMLTIALVLRLHTGRWLPWSLAWLLHILIDIPTHSRRYWAPQFLWPFSTFTVDGISWPTLLISWFQRCKHELPNAL